VKSDDNCPLDVNSDQSDLDGNGVDDACDADLDGDGVLDVDDACLDTPTGEPVLDNGCSVEEQCPCDAQWKNHGGYVSCVSGASNTLLGESLITGEEHGDTQSEAARSECGHKKK